MIGEQNFHAGKVYTIVAEIPGSNGKTWLVKQDSFGKLSCNCPIWIFNKRGNRTCKHTDEYLAEQKAVA